MRQNLDLLEENLVVWWALFGQKAKCYVCPKPNKAQHPGDIHPSIFQTACPTVCRVMGMLEPIQASQAEVREHVIMGNFFQGVNGETLCKNKCTKKPTVCLPEMLGHWPIWTQTLRVSLWKRKQIHPQDHNRLLGKFYHQLQSSQQKRQLTPAYDC